MLVSLIRSAYRGDESRAGWTSEADLLEGERTDLDSVLQMIADAGSRVLLGEEHGRAVGCCQLRTGAAGVVCLGTFAVEPRLQGHGVGRWLLSCAEQVVASELVADLIEITVVAQQAELLAWYERRGFVRTGETRTFPADSRYARPRRDDLSFVVLTKRIDASP